MLAVKKVFRVKLQVGWRHICGTLCCPYTCKRFLVSLKPYFFYNILYYLDIFLKILQIRRMRTIYANGRGLPGRTRHVDDPEGLLLKAVLEQAVVDLVMPNQYVDEEAEDGIR
ncbi:MAG: hypothetical protein ACOYNN_15125, partial [Terrimicrobiaceae bacterium]